MAQLTSAESLFLERHGDVIDGGLDFGVRLRVRRAELPFGSGEKLSGLAELGVRVPLWFSQFGGTAFILTGLGRLPVLAGFAIVLMTVQFVQRFRDVMDRFGAIAVVIVVCVLEQSLGGMEFFGDSIPAVLSLAGAAQRR